VNTGASWHGPEAAAARVLEMQTKLHRWAGEDEARRFDDVFNLVYDPSFLAVAWARVRGNVGARSAGVDGETAHDVEAGRGVDAFLDDLRADLKAGTFRPLPVRERMIPKPGTRKRRRLGIPTVRDRVVQAALKLVLEPIFEQDFQPCSYGFRPFRRAQDAIAEIQYPAAARRPPARAVPACAASPDASPGPARCARSDGSTRAPGARHARPTQRGTSTVVP
jgi:RNA-directed DNA polymerase